MIIIRGRLIQTLPTMLRTVQLVCRIIVVVILVILVMAIAVITGNQKQVCMCKARV